MISYNFSVSPVLTIVYHCLNQTNLFARSSSLFIPPEEYFWREKEKNKKCWFNSISCFFHVSLPLFSVRMFQWPRYAEENKIIIGEDSYSIEEIDFVCMYRHSSRIKQEERVNSNPFQGLVSPTLSKKEQKKLDEYFSDWGFRNEGIWL